MSDDDHRPIHGAEQPEGAAQPEDAAQPGDEAKPESTPESTQSKLGELLVRAARGLALPIASYYTGIARNDESGQGSLDPKERAILGAALIKLVREANGLYGDQASKAQPIAWDAKQPIGLTEIATLTRLVRGLGNEAPQTDDSDPVAREIELRRQLADARRDRLTQMAERTAAASWNPPTPVRAPVPVVPVVPARRPVTASRDRGRDPGARITQPLRVSRSTTSPSEAPMSNKTLSFASRRSKTDHDEDVWPAPIAAGPPVRSSSPAREGLSYTEVSNVSTTTARVAPRSGGCCGGSRAPMTCAPATRTATVVVTNADGSCSPNPFKMSCETKLGLINCFKRVICELLWCLEEELCENGRFDLKGIEVNQLLDCLSVALCSAIRCIPEVLCPTPNYPQLCATPCDDGFAVEESLR